MSLAHPKPTFARRAARSRVLPKARIPGSRPITPSAPQTYPKSLSQPSVESLEQAFTHAPIDLQNNSIRLLEVLPADPNDPNSIIQCRLRHDTTTAVYTCLSYVWGPEDPLRKRMILINGKTFWVRHNLVKFLEIASQRQARENNIGISRTELDFEEAVQSLWVDALCIDQLNLIEKSHQVQRMGMIYSNADHVIAWLGKDQKLRHWFPRVEMLFKDYLEISYNQEFIDGLRDLCHDDYWHRAWITQETILAQHICYLADDEALCPDTTLATVLDSVAAGDLNMSNWAQQMIYRRDHHRTLRRQGRKLMQNLTDFISKDCLDPRDKIYSLLSISCDVADIAVDYNSPPIALAKTLSERLGLTCICKAASIKLIFKALGLYSRCLCATFSLRVSPIHIEGSCRHFSQMHGNAIKERAALDDPGFIYCLDCTHVKGNIHEPQPGISTSGSERIYVHRVYDQVAGTQWKVREILASGSRPLLLGISVDSIDAVGNAVFRVSLAQFCRIGGSQRRTVCCLEPNSTKRIWEFLPDSEIAMRDCCRFG